MSRAVPFRRLGRLAPLLGTAVALALAFWGATPGFQAVRRAAVPVPVSPELARGSVLRRRLAAGESHPYHIHLQAGSSLRLAVLQRGTDVCVSLWSPAGERLLEVDSPNGTEGREELAAVAPAAGVYRIAVRGAVASPGGMYELRVEEVRPATVPDRRRAAAVQAFARAEELRAQGRAVPLRSAIQGYEEALRQWPEPGESPWRALVLRRLGQTWFTLGEVRRAQAPLQQALSLSQQRGDRTEEARLLNEIGPTWRLLGEPDKAADCYQRVLRLARETGDRTAESTALNNLGVVYHPVDTQRALTFFEQALAGWRELADPVREADTLHNLGEIYTRLGRLEESIALLSRALALKRQVDDRRGQAVTLSSLGWTHYQAGHFAAALRAYDRSLTLRRETGDRRGEAATLDRRATVLAKLGRTREALAGYRTALAIFRRIGDRSSEAHVLTSLGGLDVLSDRPAPALRHYEEALRRFHQIGDLHGEAHARLGSARAARKLGRLALAQEQSEAALRIVESVHREVQNRAFRTSYLASRQEYYELYVQVLMERHAQEPGRGWEAKALEASNRARARTLLESLAEAQADHLAATEPELRAAAQALETRIRARELRRLDLLGDPAAGREIAALERELSALLLESENLQGRMRGANPRIAALRQAPPLTVREIQRLLDPDTLLLWYALGTERSFLWVVGPDSIAAWPLAGRAEIETAARQVHSLLTHSHKKGLREQARLAAAVLSDRVLGPAAGRLGRKRLLIASDGALQYIPFAALPVGRGRVPLLAGHEIVHIPSAAVLALVRRGLAERRPAPGTLAVVADPVFRRDDPRVLRHAGAVPARLAGPAAEAERATREAGLGGFDRLVYSAAEAQAILSLVPEAERLQAVGFRASRATVLGGELRRYRILHFATHGLLNARHPELSGVVLSLVDEAGRPQDGFLRVHDLVHQSFPADLVVLSACRTALGKEIPGEGLVGLTHGFLVAGAGRVLVSLWNVNDLATAELMERFYRHLLRDRMRPAEALRAAQLSMLREERWAAPYYWAGFTLQGEWR